MSGTASRKKVPKKTVSKEGLRITALKKKETTIRAMAIIEKMIEDNVEEKWLIDSVHFITQDQYQDITEERAITHLCGYPLCCKLLRDIPSKTYHISTKQNKVYDITDRKNFCSSGCYKASVYLKNQLLSSPLWLRDAEEKPDYKVLHMSQGGSLGAEVDLGHSRVRLSDVNLPVSAENSEDNVPTPFQNSVKPEKEQETWPLHRIDLESSTFDLADHREEIEIRGNSEESLQSAQVKLKDCVSSETGDICCTEKTEGGQDSLLKPNLEYPESASSDCTRKTDISVSVDSAEVSGRAESILCKLENLKIADRAPSSNLTCRNPSSKNTSDSQSLVANEDSTNNSLCQENLYSEGSKIVVASGDSSKLVSTKKATLIKSDPEYLGTSTESIEEYVKIKLEEDGSSKIKNSNDSISNLTAIKVKEEVTENITNSASDIGGSESTKTNPSPKKPSIFKKERRKTKKQDDKIDQKTVLLEVVKYIENCLREWMTFDSLILLLGEETVKNLLRSKGTDFKDFQNYCGTDASTYEKYLSICKKLNMLELEDARADAALKEKNAELKPLPDYSLLQREAKQLEIKVRSFYAGSTRIETNEEAVKNSDNVDEGSVVLPLVDLHAQKALRRRIVLDRLNVILPDLGRTLNLSVFNLTSAVRGVTQTFNFSSNNITFKPPEWYFIAMVLVKLLSLQDKNMQILLESGSSSKYLTLLLMNWGLDAGYLDRLVSWLTDIDYLLQRTS